MPTMQTSAWQAHAPACIVRQAQATTYYLAGCAMRAEPNGTAAAKICKRLYVPDAMALACNGLSSPRRLGHKGFSGSRRMRVSSLPMPRSQLVFTPQV